MAFHQENMGGHEENSDIVDAKRDYVGKAFFGVQYNVQHKKNVRKAKDDSARANKGRPAKREGGHRAHEGGINEALDFLRGGNAGKEKKPHANAKEHSAPQAELDDAGLFAAKKALDKKRMAHKVQGDRN